MKVFNWFFIVFFVISAGLQYNDPDPYIWVPIYLFAAYLCYESIKGRFNFKLYLIAFLVYAGYAIGLFIDRDGVLSWVGAHHAENIVQTMKAEKPWIEETREFGGLLICIIVLGINSIYLNSKPKRLS